MAKYLWVEAVNTMDKKKNFNLFCTRLRSLSVAGLNTDRPIPNYICTNRGSLNGKHFKILVQTIGFCLYDLVPDILRTAWSSLSRLVVLAWYSEIDDLHAYLVSLELTVPLLYTNCFIGRTNCKNQSRFCCTMSLKVHLSCWLTKVKHTYWPIWPSSCSVLVPCLVQTQNDMNPSIVSFVNARFSVIGSRQVATLQQNLRTLIECDILPQVAIGSTAKRKFGKLPAPKSARYLNQANFYSRFWGVKSLHANYLVWFSH